jgi:hypothetical protein
MAFAFSLIETAKLDKVDPQASYAQKLVMG